MTRCSWWLWLLWRNLVPTDRGLHAICCPGDRSRCIHTFLTLHPDCGEVYPPSDRHICYTIHRGSSHAVAIYTMPGNVYAFLWPSTTFYLPTNAVYLMPHSLYKCLAARCCDLIQYSLRIEYIACRCICFTIIIFYKSEICYPIFTHSNTIPSVLHILHWSIIGLQFIFLLSCIHMLLIIALMPVDISGSWAKPLEFSHGLWSQHASEDGIPLVTSVTFSCIFHTSLWHPKMQFVFCAMVFCWDVCVSALVLRCLKHHSGWQMVKKRSRVNTCCFHVDYHSRHWVLPLFHLTHDCRKSELINPLLVALW